MIQLHCGDSLELLKTLNQNSVDALVTDPPAGISFMNKAWDDDKGGRKQWIAWMTSVMQAAYVAMKPGAHGLIWALPRTSHWTATALEDAGFEVRDVVTHLFGSGFPKSYNVAQSIEKTQTIGRARRADRDLGKGRVEGSPTGNGYENLDTGGPVKLTTLDALRWQGFGTALKPASEHWILVRKPLSEKTVAANVLKWGTGALNIDASRIGNDLIETGRVSNAGGIMEAGMKPLGFEPKTGRFPANLVLSHSPHCEEDQCDLECAVKMLDAQATQDVSRFFYCAKISRSERNAGLEGMPEGPAPASARSKPAEGRESALGNPRANFHPTVKSKKLMSYLIKMVTPPNGIVLDPFMGSGSTGVAAKECGFDFIGIEKEAEYFEIAKKRIDFVKTP